MVKFPIGQLPFVFRFWWLWELIAFILVGYGIGFAWAIALIVLGSVAGFLLIRRQGATIMKQMKQEPMQGMFAMMHSVENSLMLLSGFLLMIPGFLTDIIAIICLIPMCRRGLIRRLLGFNLNSFAKKPANQSPKPSSTNTIEGECWQEKGRDHSL